MKTILLSIKKVRNWTIFAAVALGLFGIQMIWRTTYIRPIKVNQEESYSKSYIAPNVYIVNSIALDSLKGWQIKSEMLFTNSESLGSTNEQRLDLFEDKNIGVLWMYRIYYAAFTLFLIGFFYCLFQFFKRTKEDAPFDRNNLNYIAYCGKFISGISFLYLFGNMAINIALAYFYNINIEQHWLHYDGFLMIFFFGLIGMIIQLVIRLALKGVEIQNENDLTV